MKPTIIYILGSGHSGTTLANLLLGQHPEVESCGVIKKLGRFVRRDGHDGNCNCGEPLETCPVWGKVLNALNAHGIDPDMLDEQHASSPDFAMAHLLALNTIHDMTGARFFVDKSLGLKRLQALQQIPDVDLVVVHCVRDPRAVALSNARKGREYLDSIKGWEKSNSKLIAFRNDAGKSLPWYTLKYERMAMNSSQELEDIGRLFSDKPLLHSEAAWKRRVRHDIGGNRMARNEEIEIRVDTAYLDLVSDADWRAANKKTAALMERFGYAKDRDEMRANLGSSVYV